MKKSFKVISLLCLINLLILLGCYSLTSCTPVDKQDIINKIIPNDIYIFLAHVLATIILLIICIFFVWKPTKKALAERSQYIQKQIKDAEQAKANSLKELHEIEKIKLATLKEAKTIVDTATFTAKKQSEQIELEAQKKANRIYTQAQYEADKTINAAKADINKQVLDIAFAASKAFLKKNVNKKQSDEFVNDFIKSLNDKKGK